MQKKRKQNLKSVRNKRRMRQLGLVEPITKADNFAAIQKQWYSKLAKTGFKDLEWVDHSTGRGQNSDYLRGSLAAGKPYHAGRALYYQLATNYYAHCARLKGYNRFIWGLHANGATYEDIIAQVKQKYKRKTTIYTLYYQIQELARKCWNWNNEAQEGLFVKRSEDKIANEVLADFGLTEYNWIVDHQYAAEMRKAIK